MDRISYPGNFYFVFILCFVASLCVLTKRHLDDQFFVQFSFLLFFSLCQAALSILSLFKIFLISERIQFLRQSLVSYTPSLLASFVSIKIGLASNGFPLVLVLAPVIFAVCFVPYCFYYNDDSLVMRSYIKTSL